MCRRASLGVVVGPGRDGGGLLRAAAEVGILERTKRQDHSDK